jgi:hypothetical protein
MRRSEPPSLATWILDHAVPGRDEGLAGDLREEFQAGRSDGWYWRQTMSACALGWLNNLNDNRALLVFAVLWSTLAPAWTILIDRFENNASFFGHIRRMDFPFSSLTEFAVWTGCNLVFLWTGMLLYLLPHALHRKGLSKHKIRRAILVPVVMFNVTYVGMFVLMNLFAFPGPVVDRRTATALGEIIDVRQWAMVLRLPYLLTMVCALWETKGFAADRFRPAAELAFNNARIPSPASSLEQQVDARSVRGPIALFAGAGLLNSLIAAILLCRLPEAHFPSVPAMLLRAVAYVLLSGVAGVAGAWFYWKRFSAASELIPVISFRQFALICAASWAWAPAAVLMAGQDSPAAAAIAVIGGTILAVGLRKSMLVPDGPRPDGTASAQKELFTESLSRPARESQGYIIALCVYAGVWALSDRSTAAACALLAVAGFVFAWELILPAGRRSDRWDDRGAALRLACIAMPAVLVTAWALLDGVAHRNQVADAALSADPSKGAVNVPKRESDLGGYESIVLWPFPEKKQITPPVRTRAEVFGPGAWQSLIIRFDGPYFYFQPGQRPGSDAHQAHGSPLSVRIESTNTRPLTIEAHQKLSAPIPIARCREMEVQIRNRDNLPGEVSLAILLRDSTAHRGSALFLGHQPIESTERTHFTLKTTPVYETLRFTVPAHAEIQKFDEITVLLLPDIEHALVGPKIAIQQFQLFPR